MHDQSINSISFYGLVCNYFVILCHLDHIFFVICDNDVILQFEKVYLALKLLFRLIFSIEL
jgi:hypothetical protein